VLQEHFTPALRSLPYPYKAILAICSDLDETPAAEVYWETMRFLNTRVTTPMGEGVGLEVGNTIYFDMPPGQFAYWSTDDSGRSMARALMASGHIDCLHSYGDLATTRAHAERALEELRRHNLSLKVWIDHAVAPTNFGADIMRGHGDEFGHPAYHADLTLAAGVRYVWRGRVSSIIGQDSPVNTATSRTHCHPRASTRTVLKEAAKQILGRNGRSKYAFHATNRVCAPARLRDGQPVIEFLRCNPHPKGLDFGDTGRGISEVLTREFFDRLVERQGFSVLYTHLGKLRGRQFDQNAVESFRLLARYQDEGKVLVTTTRRMLDFRCAMQRVTVRGVRDGSKAVIEIETKTGGPASDAAVSRAELEGLTFFVPTPDNTEIRFNGVVFPEVVVNPPDESGRGSVSIPWSRLQLPRL
jgi:hypothetical protein